MTDVYVSIEGIDQLLAKLEKMQELAKFLDEPASKWADGTFGKLHGMQNYGPEKPGQVYQRTGDLGASWATRRYGDSSYGFGAGEPYAADVVGDSFGRGQKDDFSGRWWLALERIEGELAGLIEEMSSYIQAEFNR